MIHCFIMPRQYISTKEQSNLLNELKVKEVTKRKEISKHLELAINEGDMRECDAYYVAMDMMIENDTRIKEIKEILKNSHTKDVSKRDIKIGSKLL